MVDNVAVTAGTGTTIATDDVGGVHYQITKIAYGALDTATLVTAANGLPISNLNSSVGPTAFSASDAVVGAPDGAGTPTTGASTAGSIVSIAVPPGMESWTMEVASYGTGAIYTEASLNSTNGTDGTWVAVKGRRTGTAVGVESVVYTMVANGMYRGNIAGFTYFRARLIGTGTPSIRINLSPGNGATFMNSGIPAGTSSIGTVVLGAGSAAVGTVTVGNASLPVTGTFFQTTQPVSIATMPSTPVTGTFFQATQPTSLATLPALATGANSIGTVVATPTTPTASIVNSAATTNATSVKASAGTLYSITVSNVGAAAAFLKIYNSAAAPTVGTTTIALTIPVPASGVVNIPFGAQGMRFGTGIALAITNLVADADATVIAAGQVKVLVSYI